MDNDLRTSPDQIRPHALVWVDSQEAIVVRWQDDQARIERITAEIPEHHDSPGHLRHDPAVRHGGGRSQETEEARRREYTARFLKEVTNGLPTDADLTVLGPGTTHEHLTKVVRASDTEHHRVRQVTSQRSSRKTDRQLVALLREIEGEVPPRRTVGEEHPSRTRTEVVS